MTSKKGDWEMLINERYFMESHETDPKNPSGRKDPEEEGHTREWQDRARVVMDSKKAVQEEASPKQSPTPEKDLPEGDKEKNINKRQADNNY